MRSVLLTTTSVLLLALAGCGEASKPAPTPSSTATPKPTEAPEVVVNSIDDALAGNWRPAAGKARDAFRHPKETLEFFEVGPTETVVEIWPGGGWYTSILAPYLKAEGKYIAAGFDPDTSDYAKRGTEAFAENYVSKPNIYGNITVAKLGPDTGPITEPNSVDTVLTFRNVHNWMSNGYADKVFADMFAVLKPGGILGVVEHRLPSSETQNPKAGNGYVHEDYVKQLAADAGFEFVGSSEINANPKDTADHPFGVWTLPPNKRSKARDGSVPEGFDAAKYEAIGESDRMTLKFKKPMPETPEE